MVRLLVVLALLAPTAFPQSTDAPTVGRDPVAVATVQTAITAMGGSAIGQTNTGLLSATITSQRHGWPSGTETIEFSGQQFRDEFTTSTSTAVSVTSTTGGTQLQNGKTSPIRAHVVDARFIPELAALELFRRYQDPNYSITFGGTASVNGRTAAKIQLRLERDDLSQAGTVQVWFIDTTTGLPVRIEYRFPKSGNGLSTSDTAVEFSDWRSVSGVLVPFQMNTWLDGDPWNQVALQSVSFNVTVNPSDFTISGGTQ
jgi:hypothetical protein